MCTDQGDDIEEIKRRIQPLKAGTDEPDSKTLEFEYNGRIHFNWAACVLEPNSFDGPNPPDKQIERMLFCIQIAHTFEGACNAFHNLFFKETIDQVNGYVQGWPAGRSHVELNRLRTLALAVVSLTRFEPVTPADEDQAYFRVFDEHANISKLHGLILSQCDVLFNVQQDEVAEDEAWRQSNLNAVLLFLTGFTLLSVMADSFDFLKEDNRWWPDVYQRLTVLLSILLGIVLLFSSAAMIIRNRPGRGRSRSRI
jgi:hypothetical protein